MVTYLRQGYYRTLEGCAVEPGGSVYLRNLEVTTDPLSALYVEMPVTGWGDYEGDSVCRANQEALLRDFPNSFVVGTGYPNYQVLLVPLWRWKMAEDLREIAEKLEESYPLYDEEAHSELEMRLADEAWELWARDDLKYDARGRDVELDEVDEDELEEMFYWWVRQQDQFPYCEDAVSVTFPCWEDIVGEIAGHYARMAEAEEVESEVLPHKACECKWCQKKRRDALEEMGQRELVMNEGEVTLAVLGGEKRERAEGEVWRKMEGGGGRRF